MRTRAYTWEKKKEGGGRPKKGVRWEREREREVRENIQLAGNEEQGLGVLQERRGEEKSCN